MVVDLAKIERLERELREAKAQLWKEDGDRYRILVREMSERTGTGFLVASRIGESGSFLGLRRLRSQRGALVCVREEPAGIWCVISAVRAV
jgi:hypothetical protein